MAFELRELQGNIFNNNYKKEGTNQPDERGDFLLNGVLHEIAIWHKRGPAGPFQGFKISEKRVKQDDVQPAAKTDSISARAQAAIRRPDPISSGLQKQNILPDNDMDDDIPF